MGAGRHGICVLVFNFTEDYRRLPKTFEEDRRFFFRSYTNKFMYSLRVKHGISEVLDILTGEDMEYTPQESRMNFTRGVISIMI